MFWRKTRRAIDGFHPLHQKLIWEHVLSAALPRSEWMALLASLSRHNELVRRRKWALPPRTESVVVPLIRVLCEDVGRGTVGLTADLRGHAGKEGPRQQLPVRRPVRSAEQWWVRDRWLSARSELRDGSVFTLDVVDVVRKRRIVKVNPRGKRKTKQKTKGVQRILTSRALAKGQASAQPGTPPPPWIRVKVRRGPKTVIRAGAKVPLPVEREQVRAILTVAAEPFRWTQRRRSA
ncbi:hypothetical protein [Nonomuraea rhizosphaerae]|uniref:hypothetical protein n=1 Tax=Nonomuraea rhizosphaerae TaxID=2665663 RepID=UPI001C601653|nr:hypothetical protein [Nonomuraea rhizosphaerae]